MKKIICLFGLTITLQSFAQTLSVIPEPVELKQPKKAGFFILSAKTQLVVHGSGQENSFYFLRDYLKKFYGLTLLSWKDTSVKNAIHLDYGKAANPVSGAYSLEVDKNGIRIRGNDEAGVFYGLQTLIQLLPAEKADKLKIPFVKIYDYPRFGYRGLHLDVGRHFFNVDFIKKYIDFIALHKMNYFHWHLTEDQGWRIEIKKYPELTRKGAWRNGTIMGRYPGKGNDNIRYGGYYTQDEVREIVDYASKRYITIVPEIEMPGHASAAIASYPWLSCFPGMRTAIPDKMISEASRRDSGKMVQETWGVFNDVFCAGNDSVFSFLQDVIDEVTQLFPSAYIHVGGDECPKANWKKCPRCQARMQQEGLKDEHALQSYFIRRMEKYINSKGKTLIGWDEILEGGLAPNAVVMSWRGEKGGIDAAKQNHRVIMTPTTYVYFDYSQTRKEDSVTIGGFIPLEKVYGYEPIPKELDGEQAKYILGAQANVWTEYMANREKVEYMIFPRLSALSECLWSPKENKSWERFEKKIPRLMKKYELWGARYSRAYLLPGGARDDPGSEKK